MLGHARLALLHYEGAGPYPGAVGDPAGEGPAAGHAHAAFGPQGLARGSGDSRRRQGGVGKDRARPLRRHVARHQVVRDPDHRAPAGGAVGRGDGLDGRHQLRGRGLAASEIARHAEREDLGRAQLFREIRRQAPGALDLLAPCSDLRQQRRDPFRNPSSVHEPSLRQPGPRPDSRRNLPEDNTPAPFVECLCGPAPAPKASALSLAFRLGVYSQGTAPMALRPPGRRDDSTIIAVCFAPCRRGGRRERAAVGPKRQTLPGQRWLPLAVKSPFGHRSVSFMLAIPLDPPKEAIGQTCARRLWAESDVLLPALNEDALLWQVGPPCRRSKARRPISCRYFIASFSECTGSIRCSYGVPGNIT